MAPIRSIAIAGGGTGGHLIPGLAVARVLTERGVDRIVFIGTAQGLESRLVPQAGFALELIGIGGLKNKGLLRQARTLLQLPAAVAASRRILARCGAQAVLGIGGYASGPALLAARWRGTPIALLEVNVNPGLANRLAARWAEAVAVNFPATAREFRRAVVTGIPVREEFFALSAPAASPPSLLVFGGSQGARALNLVLPQAVALWRARGLRLNILHQTGAADHAATAALYDALQDDSLTAAAVPFIDSMAAAMARASLVISRSGASTLGELAAAGRAAVLVPLPTAADQHQLRNAEAFARAGAALVIPQAGLTAERLAETVERLLDSPARLAAMGAAARQFARLGAAETIADMVMATARGQKFAGRASCSRP